jgi:hypothetical protein
VPERKSNFNASPRYAAIVETLQILHFELTDGTRWLDGEFAGPCQMFSGKCGALEVVEVLIIRLRPKIGQCEFDGVTADVNGAFLVRV